MVGFLRSSAIWGSESALDRVRSLNSRFYSAVQGAFSWQRRDVLRELFVRENVGAVRLSRRSISRGLGLKVSESMLRNLGLWDRELFYLSQMNETRIPPTSGGGMNGWTQVPSWQLPREEARAWNNIYQSCCADSNWDPVGSLQDETDDEYIARLRDGAEPYRFFVPKKAMKMLKFKSRRRVRQWISRSRNESLFGRNRPIKSKELVWVLKDRVYNGIQNVACPLLLSSRSRFGGCVTFQRSPPSNAHLNPSDGLISRLCSGLNGLLDALPRPVVF